jgi:hypothetical protein
MADPTLGCAAWLGPNARECSPEACVLLQLNAVLNGPDGDGTCLAACVVGSAFPGVKFDGGISAGTTASRKKYVSWALAGPHGGTAARLLYFGLEVSVVAALMHVDRALVARVAKKLEVLEPGCLARARPCTPQRRVQVLAAGREWAAQYVREHRMTMYPADFRGLVAAGDRVRMYYDVPAGQWAEWKSALRRDNHPRVDSRMRRVDVGGRAAVVEMAQVLQASTLPLTAAGAVFVEMVRYALSASTSSTSSSSSSSSSSPVAGTPSPAAGIAAGAAAGFVPGPGHGSGKAAGPPASVGAAAMPGAKPKRKAQGQCGVDSGIRKKERRASKGLCGGRVCA